MKDLGEASWGSSTVIATRLNHSWAYPVYQFNRIAA